ncbi:MAG: peroxide stress protein YaaA [Bacteroidetes bacterium]|nr:MAG: peroxide stress protein YaaA [Bacteroidota bacterium]
MLTLLAPSKSLDFSKTDIKEASLPRLLDDTMPLVKIMQKMSAKKLGALMSMSDVLTKLNKERYMEFSNAHTEGNSKQAILSFKGGVYLGLDAETMSVADLLWAQNHVRILSGLYGVLRPTDLMQPYRLEMGTGLTTKSGKSLYAWWGEKITDLLNEDLSKHSLGIVFNLASQEYSKSVKMAKLEAEVYSANFFERRNGEYKFISFTAKKARGLLCRYIIDNRIDKPEDVKDFTIDGFKYLKKLSSEREFIFVKKG